MTHATSPSLDANDRISFGQDSQFYGIVDAPFQATVYILLPWGCFEVWLFFVKEEWIYTSIEMTILLKSASSFLMNEWRISYSSSASISGDHDDRTNRTIFRDKASSISTMIISLEQFTYQCLIYLVVRTRMQPATCSRLELTAAIAQVSAVGTGRGVKLLSSSNALTYGMATSARRQVSCMIVTASLG